MQQQSQRQAVAFDDFVRARLSGLLRFGRALTGDEHRGADLVQDALVRALPKWERVVNVASQGSHSVFVNSDHRIYATDDGGRHWHELP